MKGKAWLVKCVAMCLSATAVADESAWWGANSFSGTHVWDRQANPEESGRDAFWDLSASGDVIENSNITTGGYQGQHIRFALAETSLSYNKLLGCDRDMGIFFGIGYSNNLIRWKQNPNFNQEYFNNLNVDIGGFSTHFPCWLWKWDLGAAFDLDHMKVAQYTLYSGTLWGRYELYDNVGLHMGAIVTTGLHKNKAWPIIGLDYTWRKCLKLSLVYPVDMSAMYNIADCWALGVAQRFFWTRHRVGLHEPVPRALVEYRNSGTEGRLTYKCDPGIYASVHAGYAYGNDLIITNQLAKDGTHYKFDGAAYYGVDVTVKF